MILEATLTSKGQVTIPKKLREKLNLSQGDVVQFCLEDEEIKILSSPRKSLKLEDVAGILHRPIQKRVSLEEMNKAIAEGVLQEYESSRH